MKTQKANNIPLNFCCIHCGSKNLIMVSSKVEEVAVAGLGEIPKGEWHVWVSWDKHTVMNTNNYICGKCRQPLEQDGSRVKTNEQLLEYLKKNCW